MRTRLWAMAVALVVAGCAGPPEDATDTPRSSAAGTIVDDDGVANATFGRVTGSVMNTAGIPIQGALVLVMAIENSVTTDRNGSFGFPEVAAGKHTLRVERENYKTLIQDFTVVAGKRIDLEVVLVPVDDLNPGFLDHFHDHWRGAERYTVFDDTVEWETEMGNDPLLCQGIVGGDVPLDERGCKYVDVIPEEGRIVPPGTARLEITVTFDNPAYGYPPYLYIDPPDYECDIDEYCYNTKTWRMESGATHVLELEPLWVDHGHAVTSGWAFYIYWHNAVMANGLYSVSPPVAGFFWNDLMKSPIDIKIEAIRGTLEIDPPHPRFWQNSNVVTLQNTTQYMLCIACTEYDRSPTIQTRYECRAHCFLLPPGDIVPPGATHLEFTFMVTWYGRNAAYDATFDSWAHRFAIGYKTPDVGQKHGTWADFNWPEPVAIDDPAYGQKATYRLELSPADADMWYDTFSQWMFTIAVEGEREADHIDAVCPTISGCPYPWLSLVDIRAINEATEEQREAGLI